MYKTEKNHPLTKKICKGKEVNIEGKNTKIHCVIIHVNRKGKNYRRKQKSIRLR